MAKRRTKPLSGASLELQEIELLTRKQLKAFESKKNLVLNLSMILI